MSVTTTFYHFNKKINSTKIPTNSVVHKTFDCFLLSGCSLINPVLRLESQLTSSANAFQSPTGDATDTFCYTYAYIQNTNMRRYYFVSDITYVNNEWIISLTEDVLATYKNAILDSTQYISRSASDYNSKLTDTLYPVYSPPVYVQGTNPDSNLREYSLSNLTTASGTYANAFLPSKSLTDGCVVLGVVSSSSTGLRYYVMNFDCFCNVLSHMFTVAPSDTGLTDSLAHMLFDFQQYVKFCRWYPIMPSADNLGNPITSFFTIAGQRIYITGDYANPLCYGINSKTVIVYDFSLGVPVNPQVTEGVNDYLSYDPYAQYNLFFAPIGNIPLDSTKLLMGGTGSVTNTKLRIIFDLTTSITQIEVINRKANGTGDLIYTGTTNWGFDLPIYNMIIDPTVGIGLTVYEGIKNIPIQHMTGIEFTPYDGIHLQKETTNLGNMLDKSVSDVHDLLTSGAFNGNFKELADRFLGKGADGIEDAFASAFGHIQSTGVPNSILPYKMGDPFIYAYFYRQVNRDIAKFGAPSQKANVQLSSLSGYCQCSNANIDSFSISQYEQKPTLSEQVSILSYLNKGFYIE